MPAQDHWRVRQRARSVPCITLGWICMKLPLELKTAAHLGLKGGGVAGPGIGDGLRDQVLVVLRVVAVVAHACVPAVVPCAITGIVTTELSSAPRCCVSGCGL